MSYDSLINQFNSDPVKTITEIETKLDTYSKDSTEFEVWEKFVIQITKDAIKKIEKQENEATRDELIELLVSIKRHSSELFNNTENNMGYKKLYLSILRTFITTNDKELLCRLVSEKDLFSLIDDCLEQGVNAVVIDNIFKFMYDDLYLNIMDKVMQHPNRNKYDFGSRFFDKEISESYKFERLTRIKYYVFIKEINKFKRYCEQKQ